MADTGTIYDETREKVSDYVRALDDKDLDRSVPATPGWTVRDIISHLAGDVACVRAGDFPAEYFAAFGEPAGIESLNRWTDSQVASRRSNALEEVLEEWKTNADALVDMMNGKTPWSDGIPPFASTILVTDLAVHQQDIYGAFEERRDRESPAIRIATAGYVVGMGWRLASAGLPPLLVVSDDSQRVAGEGEPAATVRASRFEMFRALSGRRNPEQIAGFDWDGDAAPYIPYFYPYGIRHDALVE